MTREETAEIAAPLWEGEKLYQERARRALPLLVRQAKAGRTITYGKLADELCMPNARNLNYPLGSIRASLQLLGKKWGKDTPPGIQVLVVNKNTKLPGTGIALFSETDTDFPGQVEAEQARVYAYPRWDDVLRDLNLESAPSNATLVETAKGFSGGGESEEHRQLKEYVRDHPEILGLRHKSKDATLGRDFLLVTLKRYPGRNKAAKGFSGGGESEEHRQLKEYVRDHPEILGLRHKSKDATLEERLPSGDSLDVSFESSQRWTAVEVKSAKSDKADYARGVFQCVTRPGTRPRTSDSACQH